jgi:hypothetical protein
MDSADGVTTHAIWGPTNGLPCKETIEDWQRLNFMSKSRTVKDTKRILVEVSNYTGCPAAQGGTLVMVSPPWIGLTIERAVSQLQCFNGSSALDRY